MTFQTCNIILKFLKTHYITEPSITCSHIGHVDIPKCVHWLDKQSVKICREFSDANGHQNTQKRNKIDGLIITCNYIWKVTQNGPID